MTGDVHAILSVDRLRGEPSGVLGAAAQRLQLGEELVASAQQEEAPIWIIAARKLGLRGSGEAEELVFRCRAISIASHREPPSPGILR